MITRARIFSSTVLACLACTTAAFASAPELTAIFGRFGLSGINHFSSIEEVIIPDTMLSEEQRNAALERALLEYAGLRNAQALGRATVSTLADAADTLTASSAVTANATGVVIGLALRGSIDVAGRRIDARFREQTREYLLAVGDRLVEASGALDFRALVEDEERFVSTVIGAQDLLIDIRRRAEETDDRELVSAVARSMLEVANETAVAAVIQGAGNTRDIRALEQDLSEVTLFVQERFRHTGEVLAAHEGRLTDLEVDVAALSDAVQEMEVSIGQLGRNQDLILDFALARMTPQERLRALESGAIDDRIQCPDDNPGCDRGAVRDAMSARYRAEIRVQERLQGASRVLETAGAVTGILHDLGVNLPPEVDRALQIGNAVLSAAQNLAAQNYLGAIVSLTGLFGSNRDAAAERHAQLMGYLAANFDHINAQLEGLREGQQRIFVEVVAVSGQVDRLHRSMDARFNALEFRMMVMAANVQSLLWEGWEACGAVYSYARSPNPSANLPPLLDLGTHGFRSLYGMFAVIENRAPEIRKCRITMMQAAQALGALPLLDRRGWFLDLDRNPLDLTREEEDRLLREIGQTEMPDFRDLSRRHHDSVVAPATNILLEWAGRMQINPSTLLYALATAPETMGDLRDVVELVRPETGASGWRYDCAGSDPRRRLLAEVLCNGDADASEALATRHLISALQTAFMPEAARYALVMSRLLDLHYGEPDKFALSQGEIAELSGDSLGAELIRRYLAMSVLALAHEQRLHGGLTAMVVADDIIEGRADGRHRLLLAANPYMAENTSAVLLHRWRGSSALEADGTGPGFQDRYAQALIHARSGAGTALDPLEALFGRSHGFVIDRGRPAIGIAIGEETVLLPFPGPSALAEGRFVLPRTYLALVNARDALFERFVDYELGQDPEIALLTFQLR